MDGQKAIAPPGPDIEPASPEKAVTVRSTASWDPENLVSVVVPCYNAATFIERSITSLLAQTHQNLEIIAVNDASTDNTGELLERMARLDHRLRVIHCQSNGGPYKARARGISVASGAYIGFVDCDDEAAPAMYATLLRAIQESHADIAQCDMAKVDEQGATTYFERRIHTAQVLRDDLLGHFARGELGIGSLCNKLFHRSIIVPAGTLSIPSFMMVGEDYLVCIASFIAAKDLVLVPEVLYIYHQRSTSITHATDAAVSFITIVMCYTAAMEVFATKGEAVLQQLDILYARQLRYPGYQVRSITAFEPHAEKLQKALSRISKIRPQALYALVHTFNHLHDPEPKLPLRYHLGKLRLVLRKIGNALIHGRS